MLKTFRKLLRELQCKCKRTPKIMRRKGRGVDILEASLESEVVPQKIDAGPWVAREPFHIRLASDLLRARMRRIESQLRRRNSRAHRSFLLPPLLRIQIIPVTDKCLLEESVRFSIKSTQKLCQMKL